jgi:hypothetical protein
MIRRTLLPLTRLPAALLSAALLPGCASKIVDDEREGRSVCDNLDEGQCLFPFPSDFFRGVEGGRPALRFPLGSIPHRADQEVDPSGYLAKTGFSVVTPIYFTLEGVTAASLGAAPPWNDVDASLAPASATVVLDAETGARVAHWAEIDVFSMRGDAPNPVVALRLPAPLAYGRRYVVGVRGLTGEGGALLPASPGFAALRDGRPSPRRGVGARRERFEDEVFPVLEAAGVARAELQLAWDFTTDTEANVTGQLLAVRDAMLAAIGEDGPEFEVTAVEEAPSRDIARLVRGVARVPSFLEGPRGEVQRLRLDAGGRPVAEGFEEVEFEVQIPNSVWTSTAPGAVVQYGHGLLGSKNQARGGWIRTQADEQRFVILSADMQGMAEEDFGIWLGVLLGDLRNLPELSAKPMQGLVNHLALVRMMKGRFARATDPRFTRAGGAPVYDRGRLYYLGNSQGGTMGAVMMSIQPDIERGVLGVPGGGFGFLLTRSSLFVNQMATVVILQYADNTRDMVAMMGLAQLGFDRIDPVNFVRRVSEDPFPGTPPHRVLLQVAREDAQVHNQVSDLLARSAGATLVVPEVRKVWGLPTSRGPLQGNAMVEYDFGLPNFENELVPTELDVTHGCLRKLPEARRQIAHFWATGEVRNFCPWRDGACFVAADWNEANCR